MVIYVYMYKCTYMPTSTSLTSSCPTPSPGDLLTIMEQHEGGMGEDEARFYLAEIASGLRDLHTLGFVHRDVKPENVLITRSGHIKLVDFGSAARLGPSGKVVSHLCIHVVAVFCAIGERNTLTWDWEWFKCLPPTAHTLYWG